MPNDERTIKACPECGKPIAVNCWHDKAVHSVNMPVSKAVALLAYTIQEKAEELETLADQLSNLTRSDRSDL